MQRLRNFFPGLRTESVKIDSGVHFRRGRSGIASASGWAGVCPLRAQAYSQSRTERGRARNPAARALLFDSASSCMQASCVMDGILHGASARSSSSAESQSFHQHHLKEMWLESICPEL
jgi:hypothetical protein